MRRSSVRIIDHHSLPGLERLLERARSSVDAARRAAVRDAGSLLAVSLTGLSDAEVLLINHQAEQSGLAALPLASGSSEVLALVGPPGSYGRLADSLGAEGGGFPELALELRATLARERETEFTIPLPGGESLVLGRRTLVMGILNVTPDSFSDGGEFRDPEAALARGEALAEEGADILDVGGESTRPGASEVPPDEERRRILPVIERLAERIPVPISVDTRRGAVARDALQAGARIINDVSGLSDPLTGAIAAGTGTPLILMHMRGTPATMQDRTDYEDLVGDVIRELGRSLERALDAGVDRESILVDPGIGFAKTAEQCLELLRRLPELRTLGRPLVVGPSRKSFLATFREVPPKERGSLSLGAALAAAARGAHVLRVHDVRATVEALRAFEAV